MIFISAPFNHSERSVREYRIQKAAEYSAYFLQKGILAINPTLYGLQLIQYTDNFNDTGWETWKPLCLGIMEHCTQCVVITMPGWDTSTGVRGEIECAVQLGIPVKYISPEHIGAIE